MSYNISLQHLPKSSDGKIEMIYHENLLNTFDQNSETWKSYSFENCFHHNASPLHLPLWKWLVNTIPLFCIHFIIVLIEKKIVSNLLIMRALGCFWNSWTKCTNYFFQESLEIQSNWENTKGRKMLEALLVEPENTMNINKF